MFSVSKHAGLYVTKSYSKTTVYRGIHEQQVTQSRLYCTDREQQHWTEYKITWLVPDVQSGHYVRCPMSVMSELQMAISQQRVVRSTSSLVRGLAFLSKDTLSLFNFTAHKLHEPYCDRPTS